MRRNFNLIIFLVVIIFILPPAVSADQLELQNGQSLRGEVQNDSIQITTNYADLSIQSRYLNKINRENGTFIVRASENNNFRGELLSEIVFLANGAERRFSASEINIINFSVNDSFNNNKDLSITINNGDFFFASTVEDTISIDSTLGSTLNLNYSNLDSIEYLNKEDIYLIKRSDGSDIKSDLSGEKIIVWPAAAEIIELEFDYVRKLVFN